MSPHSTGLRGDIAHAHPHRRTMVWAVLLAAVLLLWPCSMQNCRPEPPQPLPPVVTGG